MDENKNITLTYLNVRQSVVILLTKLIAIDLLLAVVIIAFYYTLVQGNPFVIDISLNTPLFLTAFALTGLIKIYLSSFVILSWLNEYYEITTEYVVHKHGIIFKKQELYKLDHVRRIDVQDSFLGEMLNFATITLFDIRLNKYLDMYLIHNARRYARVFRQLRPELELKEDHVWNPIVKTDKLSSTEELEKEDQVNY